MPVDNSVMWLHHSTTDIFGSASTHNTIHSVQGVFFISDHNPHGRQSLLKVNIQLLKKLPAFMDLEASSLCT